MLSGGSKWNRALPGRGSRYGTHHCVFPPTKNPGTLMYGSRIRVQLRGSLWGRALPTGGHAPSGSSFLPNPQFPAELPCRPLWAFTLSMAFRRTACSIKFSDMRGEFGFSEAKAEVNAAHDDDV